MVSFINIAIKILILGGFLLLGMAIIKEAPVTSMKLLLKVGAGDSLSLEY